MDPLIPPTASDDLGDRASYLGASDIAAALGLSPHKSPYALWAEKTRRVAERREAERRGAKRGADVE